MKMKMRTTITLTLALTGVMLVGGCGLSPETRERAKQFEETYQKRKAVVDQKVTAVEQAVSKNTVVARALQSAGQTIDSVTAMFEPAKQCHSKVATLVEENDRSSESALQQLLVNCAITVKSSSDNVSEIGQLVKKWERLSRDGEKMLAEYKQKVDQAEKQYDSQLGGGRELWARLNAAYKDFPNKKEDLQARANDLDAQVRGMQTAYAKAATELDKLEHGSAADLAKVTNAFRQIDVHDRVIDLGLADLITRLDRLGQTIETVLKVLQRHKDGTGTAVTVQVVNGHEGSPVTEKIEPYLAYEFYKLTKTMRTTFPKRTKIQYVEKSSKVDDDGIPVTFTLKTNIALEQKLAGQYVEETSTTPAPQGVPVAGVGNEEYGRWQENERGERSWHWNEFMLGYWMGGGFHPGYYGYGFGYDRYRRYDGWAHQRGYRDSRMGNRGYYTPRKTYRPGTYTRQAKAPKPSRVSPQAKARFNQKMGRRAGGSPITRLKKNSRVSQQAKTRYQNTSKTYKSMKTAGGSSRGSGGSGKK